MNKYNSSTIYKGNLVRNINGKRQVFKENVSLIYDDNKDVFYSFLDTFNLFISKNLEKLSKEDLEKTQRIIDENTYSYLDEGIDGQVYVDESSIELLIVNDKISKK